MVHFVVNPVSRSGKGLKLWNNIIERKLKSENAEYEIHFSMKRGDVTRIVKELCDRISQNLTIVILGGDGTLNDAVQGITDFDKVSLGYIPTGSSNDFARDMKMGKNILKTLDSILHEPKEMELDIGEVDYGTSTRKFAVSCGIGFDAAVCQMSIQSRLKKVLNKIGLGKLTYLAIAVNQIIHRPKVQAELKFDDKPSIELNKFFFAASMVHKYEGGGFMFCPKADYTDGIMDLCYVESMPALKILSILPTAFWGQHTRFKKIHSASFKTAEIKTSIPLWVHTDGEVSQSSTYIKIRTLDKKLKMIF